MGFVVFWLVGGLVSAVHLSLALVCLHLHSSVVVAEDRLETHVASRTRAR